MSDEMKSCPFCGGELTIYEFMMGNNHGYDIYHVDLDRAVSFKCPLAMPQYYNKEDAVAAVNTRAERTCKPRIIARTLVGYKEPCFWQAVCDCGWIVGEDGTPNLSEFEHLDNYCGGCGAKVVR
ncbi:MAG: hypothetical protein HFJ65_08530 [Eggerthellaceae bacterium]|nr:hypothetical protein [Eggerthellaceae bacterium]